jgi:outer membrane protein OmpA-like peptidoglycan-associated protein
MLRTLFTLFLVSMIHIAHLKAQSDSGDKYYVVIGAFRIAGNAERFVASVQSEFPAARVSFNRTGDIHYVCVFERSIAKEAFAEAIRIKAETSYKDAWVFKGRLGDNESPSSSPAPVVVKEDPAPEPEKPIAEAQPEPEVVVAEPKEEEPTPKELPKEEIAPQVPEEKPKPAGKPFIFKMTSEATGNPVIGEVQILETANATEFQSVKSNEVVYLNAPKNRAATYHLITLAPGYKPMKRVINFGNPQSASSEIGPNQEFVIALPLVRVKTGDYIEFSNVRFFPNSAILQPESQNELDGLAQLMRENEKYKIKIHGHVNGEGNRDIVSKGTSTEFFRPTNENARENASAKRLSELRADIVMEYLVSQGIDPGRIQTKGEGGKQLLYPKGSTLAGRNDRIEVEIKKGK